MVNIYKDWYLAVNQGGHFYEVLKVKDFKEDGTPARGRVVQNGFLTAAEAIDYVFEAEVRETVKKPELLDLAEFKTIYQGLAEDIGKFANPVGAFPLRFDAFRDVETRGKA